MLEFFKNLATNAKLRVILSAAVGCFFLQASHLWVQDWNVEISQGLMAYTGVHAIGNLMELMLLQQLLNDNQ